MACDTWQTHTFSKLISEGLLEIGDGYRAKNSELGGNGHIFLRAGHVTDTEIKLDGAERFREDLTAKVASKTSRPGDVLVTTKGNSTGRVAFVPEQMPAVVYSPHLSYWRSRDPNQLVPGFLRAWSRGTELKHQIMGFAHGTDMAPYLSLIDQRRLRITLPPPAEQRAIAHILGTLDDKIDLNRQMNQTLEHIAATLFKSWFVDFDPVRAKAEGRQPEGMDAETAALFPDRLVASEIGEIPEGWRASIVGDEFAVTMGQSPPGETYSEMGQGLPFYQGRVDFGFRFPRRRVYCTAPTRLASEGDTLLSVRAPVGSLNVAMEPCAIGRGVAALRHSSGGTSYTYYSLAAMAPRFEPFNSEGTVFGSISRKDLSRLPNLAPNRAVVAEFERLAGVLDARVRVNELQSRTLEELRDTLLPRLLSGELRVPTDLLDEEPIAMIQPTEAQLVQSAF
jgi:type I restriction enzyme S subunit